LAGAHACACVKAEEVSLTVSNIAMLGDRSPVSRYIYRSVGWMDKSALFCMIYVPPTVTRNKQIYNRGLIYKTL